MTETISPEPTSVHDKVRDYYGETLKSSADLRTSACCSSSAMPEPLRNTLALEDRCEDYGQVATYLGTLTDQPHTFDLDDHHHFEAGKPERVCGNTADMLAATRYAKHFRVDGDKQRHFGLFDCAPTATNNAAAGGSCC